MKVLELVKSGKIFSACFIKKDGTTRIINCRCKVQKGVKGVGRKFSPESKGLLSVYDMNSKGFRFINLNTLKWIQIEGEKYTFEGGIKNEI